MSPCTSCTPAGSWGSWKGAAHISWLCITHGAWAHLCRAEEAIPLSTHCIWGSMFCVQGCASFLPCLKGSSSCHSTGTKDGTTWISCDVTESILSSQENGNSGSSLFSKVNKRGPQIFWKKLTSLQPLHRPCYSQINAHGLQVSTDSLTADYGESPCSYIRVMPVTSTEMFCARIQRHIFWKRRKRQGYYRLLLPFGQDVLQQN